MNRRAFLKTGGSAALALATAGAASRVASDTLPTGAVRRRLVNLVPVDCSMDRIIRTTGGLRPARLFPRLGDLLFHRLEITPLRRGQVCLLFEGSDLGLDRLQPGGEISRGVHVDGLAARVVIGLVSTNKLANGHRAGEVIGRAIGITGGASKTCWRCCAFCWFWAMRLDRICGNVSGANI